MIPLAASASDPRIHKRSLGSDMTTLIISNKEVDEIIKIVKSLERFGLLIKSISTTIKNEAKEQKTWTFSILRSQS